MVRACLVILLVSVFVGAMLPAGPRTVLSPAEATPAAARPASPSGLPSPAVPGQQTILNRDPDGHFYADAAVTDVPVRFLVDTGASVVALTVADAQRIGLPVIPHEFTVVARGAAGDVRGRRITLDRVSLAGKTVERVDGIIFEGGDRSLLGQSFLGRIGTVEMSGARMVLR